MQIPVIGFSAYSGTGKTTLIEKLIPELKSKGYRVAVMKHHVHEIEMDKEGKDSWRFANVGADVILVGSAQKSVLIQQRECSFEQNLQLIRDVDLILVEGYKQENIPGIGICRKDSGKGLPYSVEQYIAVVTDDETLVSETVPIFGLDDVEEIAGFIVNQIKS